MQNVSLEHTTVIVNGERVEGWAATTDAFMVPDLAPAVTEVGADGTLLASRTGAKGGAIVLKLLANSPTTAFLMRQASQIQRGAVISWELSATNPQTGWSIEAERGVLTSHPLGQTLGNAIAPMREFEITFELISANYDGVKTARPPVQALG